MSGFRPYDAIVLGHRGFVGSAIAAHLDEVGAKWVGVDRANYEPLKGTASHLFINANGSSDRRLATAEPMRSFHSNVATTLATVQDFAFDRYVLVSSVDVYNDVADPDQNHEDMPIRHDLLSSYGFLKYMAEMVVTHYVRRWVILRLGPLVGPGLRKNPMFDLINRHTLFVHPESRYPYIDVRDAARIMWTLREDDRSVYNVCGDGLVQLSDVASILGIALDPKLRELSREHYEINIDRLSSKVLVPRSGDSVRRFVAEAASVRQPDD